MSTRSSALVKEEWIMKMLVVNIVISERQRLRAPKDERKKQWSHRVIFRTLFFFSMTEVCAADRDQPRKS